MAGGSPFPSVTRAFLVDAAAWAVSALAVDRRVPLAVATAVELMQGDGQDVHPHLGVEFHHDRSGRTDITMFTRLVEPRELRCGDLRFTAVVQDAVEIDLDTAGSTLAGVFHRVGDADLPEPLRSLGHPLLAAVMPGRGGRVRLVFPVPDQGSLARAVGVLEGRGPAPVALAGVAASAPFILGERSLRLGVDYDPASGRLGERLGLEVVVDPSDVDCRPVLSSLAVEPEHIDRLEALARALPCRGSYTPRAAEFPAVRLPERTVTASMTHFSVSWPDAEPVLKSYLLLASALPDDAMTDSAAL